MSKNPVDSPFSTIAMPPLYQQQTPGGSADGKGVHRMGNLNGNQVDNTQSKNPVNRQVSNSFIASQNGSNPIGEYIPQKQRLWV